MGLDDVEFVMSVEEFFGIRIPDAQLSTIRTPREMTQCVLAILSTSGQAECSESHIADVIKTLVLDQTGLKESKYHPDADFVKDLGFG